ncbi:MAG: 2OG-Fe(II) oxygenase [Bdellovibrionota bacterium]
MESRTIDLTELTSSGWVVHPGWMDGAFALEILELGKALHARGEFKLAGVGRGEQTKTALDIRRDEICWIESEQGTVARNFLAALEQLRVTLNRELFLGLHDFEAHFAAYPPGGFYDRHIDRFKSDDARTISAVLYLNENWQRADGGELAIFDSSGESKNVEPRLGTLVLFESATVEHAVLESKAERWSIAIWFRRQKAFGAGQ